MVPIYPTLPICQIPELDFILPIAFPFFLGFLSCSRFRSREHWIPIGPLAIRHFGFWSLGSPVPFRTFGFRRCLSKSNSIYKCMSKAVGCRLAGEGCGMRLRTLPILSHGLAGEHFLFVIQRGCTLVDTYPTILMLLGLYYQCLGRIACMHCPFGG